MLAGVDGYKNGWIAAICRDNGRTEVKTFANFRSLQEDDSLTLIVIDVPIGLPEYGARVCDQQARRYLGRSRMNSVFPAPLRSMLAARDWNEACRIRFEREGKKCSKQVAAILPKICEVDKAMTRDFQHRIREGHPELSFAMMNGERPMTYSKNSKEGRLERVHLLASQFSNIKKHLEAFPGASRDVLDAHACLWTAQRIATNKSKTFPRERKQDAMGLTMEIVV